MVVSIIFRRWELNRNATTLRTRPINLLSKGLCLVNNLEASIRLLDVSRTWHLLVLYASFLASPIPDGVGKIVRCC